MYKMSQINHIRELAKSGYRISEIVKRTGADTKTVKKYLAQDDFSPAVPVTGPRASKLDPYKGIIDGWLSEDEKNWYKQRHNVGGAHSFAFGYAVPFATAAKAAANEHSTTNL